LNGEGLSYSLTFFSVFSIKIENLLLGLHHFWKSFYFWSFSVLLQIFVFLGILVLHWSLCFLNKVLIF